MGAHNAKADVGSAVASGDYSVGDEHGLGDPEQGGIAAKLVGADDGVDALQVPLHPRRHRYHPAHGMPHVLDMLFQSELV